MHITHISMLITHTTSKCAISIFILFTKPQGKTI